MPPIYMIFVQSHIMVVVDYSSASNFSSLYVDCNLVHRNMVVGHHEPVLVL